MRFDIVSGVQVIVCVLIALTLHSLFFSTQTEAEPLEINRYEIGKYISGVENLNRDLLMQKAVLEQRLDYLENTDLAKENAKLRTRVPAGYFAIMFTLACVFAILFGFTFDKSSGRKKKIRVRKKEFC